MFLLCRTHPAFDDEVGTFPMQVQARGCFHIAVHQHLADAFDQPLVKEIGGIEWLTVLPWAWVFIVGFGQDRPYPVRFLVRSFRITRGHGPGLAMAPEHATTHYAIFFW